MPAPRRKKLLPITLGGVVLAVLLALGTWQVQRLGWKLALIEQVQRQLAAAPVPAPGPSAWGQLSTADTYRRVAVQGRFDHARETCTQALSQRGAGCWVLTPLHTTEGWWVLVNRGFVLPAQRDPATRAAGQVRGEVRVQGLLRQSEPGGGFLRRNNPALQRWTSRDVAAIAQHHQLPLQATAPYFIDAADTVPGGPEGGLTVVQFRNHHLVYALTWFSLAGLAGFWLWRVARSP